MSGCFYEKGLRFSCKEGCGACCSIPSGIVLLSENDIANIAEAVGLDEEKTISVYVGTFTSDSGIKHKILRSYSDGRCVFFENGKCAIHSRKPVQCRAYPFWDRVLRSRQTWDGEARFCPGINQGETICREEIDRMRAEFRLPEDIVFV